MEKGPHILNGREDIGRWGRLVVTVSLIAKREKSY